VSYKLLLSKDAIKDLSGMDHSVEQRILKRLEELSKNPLNPRTSKKLVMDEGERYSRVGDWRIIYHLDEGRRLIEVLAIRPRSRAYHKFQFFTLLVGKEVVSE